MAERYKYTFGFEGQAHFMRAAIESLGPLEAAYQESDWEESSECFTSNPVLYNKPVPTALYGLEVVGAVIAFTATYFATKLFDEFYDRLLKRPVGAYVDALIAKLHFPESKPLEFRDVVYFSDLDVAVVIRIFTQGQNAKDIDRQLAEAHRFAHQYLSNNGRKAPIHCHRVTDGEIETEPEFFISIKHLQDSDKARLKAVRTIGVPRD